MVDIVMARKAVRLLQYPLRMVTGFTKFRDDGAPAANGNAISIILRKLVAAQATINRHKAIYVVLRQVGAVRVAINAV